MIIKNVGRGIWTMTDLDKLALEAALRASLTSYDASDLLKRTSQGWSVQAALERLMKDAVPAAVTAYLAEAGDGWMPIETAPKDGTWFQAYRPAPKVGVCQRIVAMRWLASEDDFAWPADVFDEYNPPDIEAKDRRGFYVDVYTGGSTFTHWRPLPAPPAAQDPRP